MLDKNKLLIELEEYHQQKKFNLIIKKIESLPLLQQEDYELTGLLARAYENLARIEEIAPLEKAVSLLNKIKKEGKNDPNWHFRMGYALFYLGFPKKAKVCFTKVLKLLKKLEAGTYKENFLQDVYDYLKYCDEDVSYRNKIKTYSETELNLLQTHIEYYFGKISRIFRENISSDIYVDIYVVNPSKKRNYYTLITVGMGAYQMNVPLDLKKERLNRAELVINLPPDWNLDNNEEKWHWPFRWLRILARLPIEQNSWIGWGHSVSNENDIPFADNTLFSALMLISLVGVNKSANYCRLPDDSDVNFYNLLPLYAEELEYKCQYDAESLLHLFYNEKIKLTPLLLNRYNVASEHLKKFVIKARDLKLILKNWHEPDGCVISDRITVKGERIGYCYREEPAGDWDSGWRFFSGRETQEDLNNPDKGDVYHLNTICNYDKDIVFLLNAPIGTAFFRNEEGRLKIYQDNAVQTNILLVN